MKKSLHFLVLAGFALCALLFTSCSKDEKKEAPIIGTYTIDGKSQNIKYAYFTQDGEKYMFGLSNSNSLSTNNKNWLTLVIPEAKFNTEIGFNNAADSDFATVAISIDGRTYVIDSNYTAEDVGGTIKVIDKGNNTFEVSINIIIYDKEVECNIETKFTKIPFELIEDFGVPNFTRINS